MGLSSGRRSERAALAVVEAAYRIDEPDEDWLRGVADAARPALDHGLGAMCVAFRLSDGGTVHLAGGPVTVGSAPEGYDGVIRSVSTALSPVHVSHSWAHPLAFDTASAAFRRANPDGDWEEFPVMRSSRRLGVRDNLVAKQLDPTGVGCLIVAPLATEMPVIEPRSEARWRLVMTHVLAGLRLRSSLREAREEAVLDPSGRVLHAEDGAKSQSARDALREAAKHVVRAGMQAGRGDPDAALRAWRGLVRGRWSLVDRFDSDGRRYLVARPNEPGVRSPRALSQRERQVLAYAALGRSNKDIAYALGLVPSTVSTHLRAALRRLGLRHASQLDWSSDLCAVEDHA